MTLFERSSRGTSPRSRFRANLTSEHRAEKSVRLSQVATWPPLKKAAGYWNKRSQPRSHFSCLTVTGTVMLTLLSPPTCTQRGGDQQQRRIDI
jgi:hypothetical protein